MNTQTIQLDRLKAHPDNSNVMPEALIAKLAGHIDRTGRYPPLIVRPLSHLPDDHVAEATPADGLYQILDGHHRALAIKLAGKKVAECVVWQADDQEALLLLATLNRLQGQDDPSKRAKLLSSLANRHNLSHLTQYLPERADQLKKYLQIKEHPPAPRPPKPLEQIPVAMHFFLLPDQKSRLNRVLHRFDCSREQALMKLVDLVERETATPVTASES